MEIYGYIDCGCNIKTRLQQLLNLINMLLDGDHSC